MDGLTPLPPGAQTQFAFVNGAIVAFPANQPLPRGAVPAFAPAPQATGPVGYTGTIRIPDTGYTGTIRIPETGYTGSIGIPSTGYTGSIRIPETGYTGSVRIADSGYTGSPAGSRVNASSPGQLWVDTLGADEKLIWDQGMRRGDSAQEVMKRIGALRRGRRGPGGGPTGLTEEEKRAAIALDKRIENLDKKRSPGTRYPYPITEADKETPEEPPESYYDRAEYLDEEEQRLRNRGPIVKPQRQTPDALERKVEQKKQNRQNRIKEIDQKLGSLNAEMDKLMGNRDIDDLSDDEYRHMFYLTGLERQLSDERNTLVQRTEKTK